MAAPAQIALVRHGETDWNARGLSQGNVDMVEAARSIGASAKFTGSGGAIVGTYDDDAMFEKLKAVLEPMQVAVLKPQVLPVA